MKKALSFAEVWEDFMSKVPLEKSEKGLYELNDVNIKMMAEGFFAAGSLSALTKMADRMQ